MTKLAGTILTVCLLVIFISTGSIRPLQMVGDTLAFFSGGFNAAEERVPQAPTPQ